VTQALGQVGEPADAAIPALVDSLGHLNAEVGRNAALALGNLGGGAAESWPALERAAHGDEGGVRSQAIIALDRMGASAPAARAIALAVQVRPVAPARRPR
jgi:HEAT repeat protein